MGKEQEKRSKRDKKVCDVDLISGTKGCEANPYGFKASRGEGVSFVNNTNDKVILFFKKNGKTNNPFEGEPDANGGHSIDRSRTKKLKIKKNAVKGPYRFEMKGPGCRASTEQEFQGKGAAARRTTPSDPEMIVD